MHMSKPHSFKEFYDLGMERAGTANFQGTEYFGEHSQRLYNTYVVCAEASTDNPTKLISFGAGSAYIENALARWHKVKVTLVEFSETINRMKDLYEENGFEAIAGDLNGEMAKMDGKFDMALSSEVIEHIPRPPVEHITLLRDAVRQNGDIIVTTPNLGNIRVIGRLLMSRPFMPPPSRTFGPVCFENEGIHRREYLPSEICDAFEAGGVSHLRTTFTENSSDRRIALRLATRALPRLRSTMILQGRRKAA